MSATLPPVLGITPPLADLPGVLARIPAALELGMGALQVRDHALPPEALAAAAAAIQQAHPALPLLLNGPPEAAAALGLWGVHLPDREPSHSWLEAWAAHPGLALTVAAHGRQGLLRAGRLAASAALLGPIKAPISKKESLPPLGWVRFGGLARGSAVPVYALGGMRPQDLEEARANGAIGMAMVGGLL